jgi:hypothetical protein
MIHQVSAETYHARKADRPQPGFFVLRLVRHWRWLKTYRHTYGMPQPWIPAIIFAPCPWVEPDETDWPYYPRWQCEPLDRSAYPLRAKVGERDWNDVAAPLYVWTWGVEISAAVYQWLMARRVWCRQWAPASFEARPVRLPNLRSPE